MKATLIGYPLSGQKSLFSVLCSIPKETIDQKPQEVFKGVCEVIDPRITKLTEMYKPKKTAYAKIEYELLPDFDLSGPLKTQMLSLMKNADELCFVAKGDSFSSDAKRFSSELIIYDLMAVEKRLENIEKELKKKHGENIEKEKIVLEKAKELLEKEIPIRSGSFSDEMIKVLGSLQLLTIKPLVLVSNVSEDKLSDKSMVPGIEKEFFGKCVLLSIEIEQELKQLSDEERLEFMKELKIDEPPVNVMTRAAYEALGLISFFTVGEDEVRAWTIKKGSDAAEAGGAIHSDIKKGFVRAEMFKYSDLIETGSEAKLKESGKFHLKGRDYIVEDGDILNFRFNI